MGLPVPNSGQVSDRLFSSRNLRMLLLPAARGRGNLENPSFAGWGTVASVFGPYFPFSCLPDGRPGLVIG